MTWGYATFQVRIMTLAGVEFESKLMFWLGTLKLVIRTDPNI